MLYSKTAKYAVLALAEIANGDGNAPMSTRRIADAAEIPYPLLAKTLGRLRAMGMVRATRGKSGGIVLARPASKITILDVVIALDGKGLLNDCPLTIEPCECIRPCGLHPLWKPARDAVIDFLRTTTIQAVAEARAEYTTA